MGLAVPGGVGVILYSSILSMSIYQIVIYLGDRRLDRGKQFLLKLAFHLIFGLYCLFDLLYYVSLYFYEEYTIWGYSFHLVSLLINLYSFTLVIYLWRITLDPRDIRTGERVSGILFLGINTISSTFEIVLWCVNPKKDTSELDSVTINLVYVCSILFVTCCLLFLGHQLKYRLTLSSSPAAARHRSEINRNDIQIKTLAILRRTNTVLIICAVCYGIRTAFILLLTLEGFIGETSLGQTILHMPIIAWFILTNWIPTLLPGITFLYILRYQPHLRSRKETSNQALLRGVGGRGGGGGGGGRRSAGSRGGAGGGEGEGDEDGTSSSWYERDTNDLHSPLASVVSTTSPLKLSSKSLGWEERKFLQFTRTASQATNEMTAPLPNDPRLSFHSEASNE